jgi:hypothetical protein
VPRRTSRQLLLAMQVAIVSALSPVCAPAGSKWAPAVDSQICRWMLGASGLCTCAGTIVAASGSSDLANADAERAVVRVKQKLQGLEGGEPCDMSVRATAA